MKRKITINDIFFLFIVSEIIRTFVFYTINMKSETFEVEPARIVHIRKEHI